MRFKAPAFLNRYKDKRKSGIFIKDSHSYVSAYIL
ncbi:unnamed protein product, partial [marine sediment metagenome]